MPATGLNVIRSVRLSSPRLVILPRSQIQVGTPKRAATGRPSIPARAMAPNIRGASGCPLPSAATPTTQPSARATVETNIAFMGECSLPPPDYLHSSAPIKSHNFVEPDAATIIYVANLAQRDGSGVIEAHLGRVPPKAACQQ
ncbi:hypothetical protein FB472_1845 [Rhodoglobus vestalii]|uniref:Uncharacterized protein n=1 Tax=Rhodoglobus vestalii TaxID=193384 RepID=A0A8H2PUY1_9MICO|nr:hypothetical protein FB472_1845 [Rhodoglobus vestalii]